MSDSVKTSDYDAERKEMNAEAQEAVDKASSY